MGEVGTEGNVTGAHLHYEFHPTSKGVWSCAVVADPAPTLEEDVSMKNVWAYEYSGKPKGTLTLPIGKYVKLDDIDTPDPGFGGLELKMLYLNLTLDWGGRDGDGNVRVKWVREPAPEGDATAYQDFAVHSGQTDFLLTHQHFEVGEKDKGGRWHVKVSGDMIGAKAGTRYSKWASIRKDLA